MNCSSDPQSSSKYHRGPGSMKWSKESSKPSSANEQPSQAQRPQPQLPHFEMNLKDLPGPGVCILQWVFSSPLSLGLGLGLGWDGIGFRFGLG